MPTDPLIDWLPAVAPPPLSTDAIHVWQLASAPAPQATQAWLDDDEQARLARAPSAAARARLLGVRAGLRRVLAGYLGCAPQAVALQRADGGKPFVADGPCFNLTHSGALALLAVAPVAVGIDVELLRQVPRCQQIAERVLDAAFSSRLAALPAAERSPAFIAGWTAMEARQKCLGQGVFGRRVPPEAVGELSFRPDSEHLARLAWSRELSSPDIHWFAQTPLPRDHDPS